MRFGFVGPAYTSPSVLADAEQLINFKVQKVESPNARVPFLLLPTPGLSLFAALGNFPSTRGAYTAQGRSFFVAGTHLCEVGGIGNVVDYGGAGGNNNMVDDGLPVTMVAGGTSSGTYPGQLLIASGGTLTAFDLRTNQYVAITNAPAGVLMIDFLDGFFVALTAGNSWQVSNVEDCTNWSGLAVTQVSVFSDQLLALIASNRLLWVFGAKRAVAYYNSGAALFPFDIANGSFMEVGILAQYSPARVATKAGTTIAWLAGDERGAPVVYAAQGFTPQRISDHGLEYWMSQQAVINDAVGWARHDEEGNNYYDLWFPSANATWTLDMDLGFWHQRSSLVNGLSAAHLGRCHTYNFGLHLVGDRNSGNVYGMSSRYLSENTAPGVITPIIRTRVGPSISSEGGQLTVPINEFQVDFETGLGPQPPLTDANGNPRDPYAMFSYSEDFGKTWMPDRLIPCGQAGRYRRTAIDRRLGSWHSWTPRVTVSDPVRWVIADAYTNGTQDSAPRLAKSFARIA